MPPPVETQQPNPNAQKEEEEEEAYYSYANNLAMSVVLPMAMRTAVELDVFEIIGKADCNPNTDRILRLLASYRVLDCSVSDRERLDGISPVAKYFVSNEDGVSLAPYLLLPLQSVYLEPKLKDAITEGGNPFNMVHGVHIFEYVAARAGSQSFEALDEKKNLHCSTTHRTIVMKKIVESYKGFEQFERLVDVGGGLGMTISVIISKYPHIKAINFDLPHVIKEAPSYPLFYDTGVEHLSGDMFQTIPKGDAIILKFIVKECYEAIPEDGKVIVINGVLPVVLETNEAARDISLLHVRLLIMRDDGATERTKEEFVALASGSGFKGVNVVCCVCNYYSMELYK
ncbi:hypothetical protein ACOSQ4_000726 [Xanthoceras sorbifolium]